MPESTLEHEQIFRQIIKSPGKSQLFHTEIIFKLQIKMPISLLH